MKRTKSKQDLLILTNDPSFTAWGWVVVTPEGELIEKGCIKTESGGKKSRIRKGDHLIRRISEINKVLLSLIRKYKITYILSELPHGSQNAKAAVMIGATAAIMQSICDTLDIGIEWYSEGDAKKCLLGKLSASKDEIKQTIAEIYDIKYTGTKYIDEAVADAMAIFNIASNQSSTLKLFRK